MTNNNKGHPGKRSTVEYWVDTLRKSREGISTESSGKNSMTGLKKTQAKNLAYMSSSHYLRQMAGLEKTGKNTADPTGTLSIIRPSVHAIYRWILGNILEKANKNTAYPKSMTGIIRPSVITRCILGNKL